MKDTVESKKKFAISVFFFKSRTRGWQFKPAEKLENEYESYL